MKLEFLASVLLIACGGETGPSENKSGAADAGPTAPPGDEKLGTGCDCGGKPGSCSADPCGPGLFCLVTSYAPGRCTRECGERGQTTPKPECPANAQCTFTMDNDQRSPAEYCFILDR